MLVRTYFPGRSLFGRPLLSPDVGYIVWDTFEARRSPAASFILEVGGNIWCPYDFQCLVRRNSFVEAMKEKQV